MAVGSFCRRVWTGDCSCRRDMFMRTVHVSCMNRRSTLKDTIYSVLACFISLLWGGKNETGHAIFNICNISRSLQFASCVSLYNFIFTSCRPAARFSYCRWPAEIKSWRLWIILQNVFVVADLLQSLWIEISAKCLLSSSTPWIFQYLVS